MTKGGKLMEDIFEGATINTVSMLCIEDAVDAMEWGKSIGGLKAMQARADANFKVLTDWVQKTDWVDFLAQIPEQRSNTSVCLVIVDAAVKLLDDDGAGGVRQGASCRGSTRPASPMTSAAIATRRRACASGPARRSRPPISRR